MALIFRPPCDVSAPLVRMRGIVHSRGMGIADDFRNMLRRLIAAHDPPTYNAFARAHGLDATEIRPIVDKREQVPGLEKADRICGALGLSIRIVDRHGEDIAPATADGFGEAPPAVLRMPPVGDDGYARWPEWAGEGASRWVWAPDLPDDFAPSGAWLMVAAAAAPDDGARVFIQDRTNRVAYGRWRGADAEWASVDVAAPGVVRRERLLRRHLSFVGQVVDFVVPGVSPLSGHERMSLARARAELAECEERCRRLTEEAAARSEALRQMSAALLEVASQPALVSGSATPSFEHDAPRKD